MEEQTVNLGDLGGVVRRRGRVFLFTAGAIVLASILVAALLPAQYEAYTTLLVEPQSISKRLVEAGFEESDLTNRIHLMTMQILSRARLSKVIDELSLYPEESEEMTREEVIELMRSHIWVEPVLPELETEEMRSRQQDIQINTFRLYFRHESAATAAAVANRLANDFIDEHIKERVQISGDTAEFIEAELTRLATRIREIEAQIAQVKAENAGSLPEDRAANEILLQRALEATRESQRRLAEAQSDEAFYRQQATVARESEGGRGDVVGKAVSPALRLQELEMAVSGYRARGFTDRHPDVLIAQAEIEQLRERIRRGEDDPNGAPVSVAEQEARALAQRAGLRATAESEEILRLRAEVEQAQQRLAATPRVAEQLDALTREYESLSINFRDYSNKRLEAGVAANMERRQKGEQFRVLEPAFPAQRPVSPNRPLILVLGALLGSALGAALAIGLEVIDPSYHEPRSLQQQLRIPVLASIPSILLDADRLARRRRRIREVLAAAAVTFLVVSGAGVGYVFVNRPDLFGGGGAAPAAPAQPGVPGTPAAPPSPAGAAGAPAAARGSGG